MSTRSPWLFALLVVVTGPSCRNGPDAVLVTPASETAVPPAAPATAPTTAATTAPAPAPAAAPWPPPAPTLTSDFCIEGVSALDEETCYVLPATPTSELLLYFHGIVPPEKTSRQKSNFESAVQASAKRAGVAALMPRGEQGLAPRGHTGWWGWPTSAAAHAQWTPKLIEKLSAKRRKLEQLVGRPFTRLYVAGSSSGAYFTIALALNGDIAADGFGALSGAADRNRDFSQVAPKPFYIGYGTLDTVGGAAQALGTRLERAGWPVKVAAHRLPHGTSEIYLDEAFAFWRGQTR